MIRRRAWAPAAAIATLVLATGAVAADEDCPSARDRIRATCATSAGRRAWVRCLKRETRELSRDCRRAVLRCDVRGSTAGRGGVVCCRAAKAGALPGRVLRRSAKCLQPRACAAGAVFDSVCDGCGATGSCAPVLAGRWLFTGEETHTCRGFTCDPLHPTELRVFAVGAVGSVVDIVQVGPRITATWDEAGSRWPTEGRADGSGGLVLRAPGYGVDPVCCCGRRTQLQAAGLEDGQGEAFGFDGISGSCEGGVGETTWDGWLVRLDGSCGDGEIAGDELCDPASTPTGCPPGTPCGGDCTCVD